VNKGDEKEPNRTYGSEKLKPGKTVVEKIASSARAYPPTLILKISLGASGSPSRVSEWDHKPTAPHCPPIQEEGDTRGVR
jgi:hypothetical protein